MDKLDSYIISILQHHTKDLQKDQFGTIFLTSISWEKITDSFKGFKEWPYFSIDKNIIINTGTTSKTPQIEINETYRSLLINNFWRLDINILYPSIIYKYFKSGQIEDSSIVRIFCYFLENRKRLKSLLPPGQYLVFKLWINYFYGKIPSLGINLDHTMIVEQAKKVMEECKKETEEWYYIDVDTIFFYHSDIKKYENTIKKLGFEFDVTQISSGVFFAKKKYIIGNNIEAVGFKHYIIE